MGVSVEFRRLNKSLTQWFFRGTAVVHPGRDLRYERYTLAGFPGSNPKEALLTRFIG